MSEPRADRTLGEAPRGAGRTRGPEWLLAAACVVGVFAYLPALDGGFHLDDEQLLLHNPTVHTGRLADAIWDTRDRPVTLLTFAASYAWTGPAARPLHVTNLALHLLTAVLLFALGKACLRRLGASEPGWLPAVAASAFVLHPLGTQAVAYIWQRAEILSSLFCVASLLALLRGDEAPSRARAVLPYALGCAAYLLALGSKAAAVALPAVYLLFQVVLGRANDSGRRVLGVAALLGVVTVGFALVLLPQLGRMQHGHAGLLPLGLYLATQPGVVLRYARLAFWPTGQSLDHDWPVARGVGDWLPPLLLITAALVLLASLLARAGRLSAPAPRLRLVAFGTGWFLLSLAPTSLVPLVAVIDEHRAYLALWGLLLAAATAGDAILERAMIERLPAAAALVCAALAALALCLRTRAEVWRSEIALWSDVVASSPAKARPHLALGGALVRAGDPLAAERHLRIALNRAPTETQRHDAVVTLASALLAQERFDDVVALLRPELAMAPGDADLLVNQATALLGLDDFAGARAVAERSVRANPFESRAHAVLGAALLALGDRRGAASSLREAARLNPADPWVRDLLVLADQALARARSE